MTFSLVVAMARNGVIGRDNALPWHLPDDLKYFKSITMGKPIIMGRKTFESIGRPLPGRTNIVISSRQEWRPEGVEVVSSLEQACQRAVEIAQQDGVDEAMIVGGGEIYRQSLPIANRLYLTEVAADVEGDAFFPAIEEAQWVETSRIDGADGGDYAYAFVVKERISA